MPVTPPALPPPRQPGRYALAFVCTGNICRSPTADVVLVHQIAAAGLADLVTVASCGLGGWHVGDGMDPRSARQLARAGYDPTRHVASQITPSWLTTYDVLLAMDRGHLTELRAMAAGKDEVTARLLLFGDFDPVTPGVEVPDPYYGGDHGFQEVLTMVERTCDRLVGAVTDVLGGA